MNLGKFRELIGTVVILRPRPKVDGGYLKETLNSRIILDEVGKNQFLLKNTITNHEFSLTPDNIREFRSPAFVILAGQTTLKEGGAVEFEPFAPGLKEPESLIHLTDEATRLSGDSVYKALKPHEGMGCHIAIP